MFPLSLALALASASTPGNTTIVTERFHVVYKLNGKTGAGTGRATDVWVKMQGRWMCVAAHSSAIAAPGKT